MVLVAGFSHRTAGFHPESFYVGFVVGKVTLGRVLHDVFHDFPVYHSNSSAYSVMQLTGLMSSNN